MKALIVYASWFGHNRALATMIAAELRERDAEVACAPAWRVRAGQVAGYDLLVLGTYTHVGRASRRLRALCEQIPQRQLQRMSVAIVGTQVALAAQPRHPGGVDDLEACLAERDCDLTVPPLRIELPGRATVRPSLGIGPAERELVRQFVADLWEECVAAPLM